MPERSLFTSLQQARDIIGDWRRNYNEADRTAAVDASPAQFAANHRQQQEAETNSKTQAPMQ